MKEVNNKILMLNQHWTSVLIINFLASPIFIIIIEVWFNKQAGVMVYQV